MGGGEASWKWKRAARKIFVQTCGSFCQSQQSQQSHVLDATNNADAPVFTDSPNNSCPVKTKKISKISSEITAQVDSRTSPDKNLCAICLDPLNYTSITSPGRAIFTAQCSHAFHFACISSNVRHGSVTCPICRAHWTQLPRNLNTRNSLHYNKSDPVLRILDDSIANIRVHRRSFLRSARYDDDDPVETDLITDQPRLHLSLLPVPVSPYSFNPPLSGSSSLENPIIDSSNNTAYLGVSLAHQPPTDLVLVANPNGPHLRLMRQAMALVVFLLRPVDRLAIVTYSSTAARVFPLRRMTAYGKRAALQVIDRLFYMGQADPMEGLKKGVKIIGDRVHKNPCSCILHLTDTPSRSYHRFDMESPVTIHRFHLRFGFGTSTGFVMHEFEEFLARTIGGAIREIELRIGENTGIIRIGELRGGEERRVPLYVGEADHVCVEYSYVDGGDNARVRTGEIVVGIEDKECRNDGVDTGPIGGRNSSVESWEYHDPYMARRWAKHLHGYRI